MHGGKKKEISIKRTENSELPIRKSSFKFTEKASNIQSMTREPHKSGEGTAILALVKNFISQILLKRSPYINK